VVLGSAHRLGGLHKPHNSLYVNSSKPESYWPAFMVRADGVTVGRLRRNALEYW
jgi:hypothetical protein